ncbi:sugar phosphate isomerase/epimerase family protein [Rhodopirellula sp. MGV]|uniref:sugar phosphate isomerase/epimerase family protein n=1 Tax=Rhodopirellula sp. MGV TaxID=2023130 RepID=UPI000B95EFCD|nr:TIM barrel protein [Rhodopirellula sp. MGV]OYP33998.1 hypothetical protein CGZ80_17285 [Rhodopirellula sp. MGV]PNY34121.1 hypothetical protein C2E31_25105 [Rhodopirellula baltica]
MTLKKLGYDGVSQIQVSGEALATKVAAFEAAGLSVLSVYLNVDDRPINAEAIRPLANRGAMIELTVQRRTPKTVEAVRQTATLAQSMGIKVVLYPHHGFAIATTSDAMKLIEEVSHPNLGIMFNLCHYLKNESPDDLERTLQRIAPVLGAVSTCGANVDGDSWSELIQTLDRGDFPQQRLFGTLQAIEFSGPIGLQCYAIPGDRQENLKRSINAFRTITRQ